MILTPMNPRALADADYRANLEKNIPIGRAGRPDEVAGLARWLASDEGAYVTGATIVIDGGLSLLLGQAHDSARRKRRQRRPQRPPAPIARATRRCGSTSTSRGSRTWCSKDRRCSPTAT
ncbi:MAG: SDR family oxidoreductase [Sphingomonas sp.]